jgi:hypothetical protein
LQKGFGSGLEIIPFVLAARREYTLLLPKALNRTLVTVFGFGHLALPERTRYTPSEPVATAR